MLPLTIDNTYRGLKAALWIFGLIILMKSGMSLGSIFNGYKTLTTADGVPLDTYPPSAVRTILALWALFGLLQLMICLLGVLVLVRYRGLVPFMLALLLVEHLSRKLILHFLPIVRTGTPPGPIINLVLLTLMIVGLGLSLWRHP